MRLWLPGKSRLTDLERDAYERISGTERALGCGCGLVPLGLLTYVIGFGWGISSQGPGPRGPIGKFLGQNGVLALLVYFPYVCVVLGIAWLLGIPSWRRSGYRYLAGVAGLGLTALVCGMSGEVDVMAIAWGVISIGLILSALFNDKP